MKQAWSVNERETLRITGHRDSLIAWLQDQPDRVTLATVRLDRRTETVTESDGPLQVSKSRTPWSEVYG